MDILVTDERSSRLCSIQVKSTRNPGAKVGWVMQKKHEGLVAPKLFYCFVRLGQTPTDQPVCYILGSGVPFFDPLAIEAAINGDARALTL